MKAASLNEIRKDLLVADEDTIREICMRLARYKKENKELLTYLLYEANNERAYIENVKEDIAEQFTTLHGNNTYYIKKTLRKILRFADRQIRYSGIKETELEIRIYFCTKIKEAGVPLQTGTVLYNLYQQQLKKINGIFEKLPADLQGDYEREMSRIAR